MKTHRYLSVLIIICVFILTIVSCDSDIFKEVLYNSDSSFYKKDASGFTATQVSQSLTVTLAWTNPSDGSFSNVLLLRKTGDFPTGPTDTGAISIYTGANQTVDDTSCFPNNVYFYILYTKDNTNRYSLGVKASIEAMAISDTYSYGVNGFTGSQTPGTYDVSLSWTNPVDSAFDHLYLVRNVGNFAINPGDGTNLILVDPKTDTTFTDNGLAPNIIYYYTLYTFSTDNKNSLGSRKSIEIVTIATSQSTYAYEAANFSATLGDTSIGFSWTNPSDSAFNHVLLLRKTTGYPTGPTDSGAATVYSGSGTSYTDTPLSVGTTYYYSIYAVNNTGAYSQHPPKINRTVDSFTKTIRDRCFYLIGGSSSYGDPFNNLVTQVDAFDPATVPAETVHANIATLPKPRYGCAVASAGGKIFVFGGLDQNKNVVSQVDVLDIASTSWPANVWTVAYPMPLPRFSLKAENVNGKIYVFGGSDGYFGESMGSPTYLNNVYQLMKNTNHIYDPLTNSWMIDDAIIPVLVAKYMNCISGSYGGNLFYASGRYNGTSSLTNVGYIHNMTANYSLAITAGGTPAFPAYAEQAEVLYVTKNSTNNEDIVAFFSCGGTNTASISEPIRAAGATLVAKQECYYVRFPNSSGGNPAWSNTNVPILNTNRAYAEAEFYGKYIYVFFGVNANALVTTVEKLLIPDDLSSFSTWQAPFTPSGMPARFGFDMTKVIY